MGQIAISRANEIESKKKKEQNQAVLDNAEIGIVNDEACLDLTDLVTAQAEEIAVQTDEIENLKAEIELLKNGGNKEWQL